MSAGHRASAAQYMPRRLAAAREHSMLLRIDAGYQPHPGWQKDRACAGLPAGWWFDGKGRGPTMCARCPVRMACLAANLAIERTLPSTQYAVGHIAISAKARQQYLATGVAA